MNRASSDGQLASAAVAVVHPFSKINSKKHMKTQLHSPVALVRIARVLTHHLPHQAARWAARLALAALAFGPPPAQAQAAVTEAWVHRFSNVVSNSTDRAVKVVRDAAGDIIVTGTTAGGIPGQDMLTIKYSGADGSVLWQQRYNGPSNGDDQASALAVDGSGNVVVTGSSADEYDTEYFTAKYAAADGAPCLHSCGMNSNPPTTPRGVGRHTRHRSDAGRRDTRDQFLHVGQG